MLRIHDDLAAALLGMLLVACSPDGGTSVTTASAAAGTPAEESTPRRASNAPLPASPGLPDFSALVERYGDAVVNVNVVGHGGYEPTALPDDSEDPLHDFFRRFGMPAPRAGQPGAG